MRGDHELAWSWFVANMLYDVAHLVLMFGIVALSLFLLRKRLPQLATVLETFAGPRLGVLLKAISPSVVPPAPPPAPMPSHVEERLFAMSCARCTVTLTAPEPGQLMRIADLIRWQVPETGQPNLCPACEQDPSAYPFRPRAVDPS